jgi:hypothetical protein
VGLEAVLLEGVELCVVEEAVVVPVEDTEDPRQDTFELGAGGREGGRGGGRGGGGEDRKEGSE